MTKNPRTTDLEKLSNFYSEASFRNTLQYCSPFILLYNIYCHKWNVTFSNRACPILQPVKRHQHTSNTISPTKLRGRKPYITYYYMILGWFQLIQKHVRQMWPNHPMAEKQSWDGNQNALLVHKPSCMYLRGSHTQELVETYPVPSQTV